MSKREKKSKQPNEKIRNNIGLSGLGIAAVIVFLFINFFFMLVPINLMACDFWLTLIGSAIIYSVFHIIKKTIGSKHGAMVVKDSTSFRILAIPAGLLVIFIVLLLSGASIFHAKGYASILSISDAEFTEELSEATVTSSIALMDTASAKKLGDREIGALANVVSQFDVSDSYTQIDHQGTPIKVSPLYYAGFFKWINNNDEGVPGYVTVNPVSMTASYNQLSNGMKYVPSAYLLEDAGRHIWLHYPTTMWGNLHFEIDEEGNPYYIASVYDKKISLLSGKTVSGCIVMDPVTGATEKYELADVPNWVDMVYDGNILCEQYNWYGNLSNGFWNSVISKKGCKKVTSTQVYSSEDDEYVEMPDFGYVAKDGDIWIYTGVTSVNSDSSNIGFLLANERTGESKYFSINGADEKSAMSAAEGEVQEKRYIASFPSLINIEGNPTYIMVLKDASGLVKLYAAVNVEQYNLVTTASTQSECINQYKKMLGLESGDITEDPSVDDTSSEAPDSDNAVEDEPVVATETATITIKDIKFADINGNTYIYLITEDDKLFKAKISSHEEMLLLKNGDTVDITYGGNEIAEYSVAQ